jgi:hypothetical protein
MSKKVLILMTLLLSFAFVGAQEAQKSELQQRAENEDKNDKIASARFLYIRAFEDYVSKGQLKQGVECGAKATSLYYKENYFQEAFDLLRRIDQTITSKESVPS